MRKELRRAKRRRVKLTAMIYARDGRVIAECEVRDVSATGAQLALPREIDLPREFVLSLAQAGQVRRRCKKVWQFSILAGVAFSEMAA
jgi:hypothetical protein